MKHSPRNPPLIRPAPYAHSWETYSPHPGVNVERPHGINGMISIQRYRHSVELIEEPIEVLQERLRELWRTQEYNIHLTSAFKRVAEELGITLDDAVRASSRDKK